MCHSIAICILSRQDHFNWRCGLTRIVKTNYERWCCSAFSLITQFKLLDMGKGNPYAKIICSIQLTLIVLLLSCCTPTMRKFTHPQMHARSDTKAISLSLTQPTSSLCVCVFPYTWVTTIQTWVSEIIHSMQLSNKYKWNTHMSMLLYNAKHAFTVWNMFVNLI